MDLRFLRQPAEWWELDEDELDDSFLFQLDLDLYYAFLFFVLMNCGIVDYFVFLSSLFFLSSLSSLSSYRAEFAANEGKRLFQVAGYLFGVSSGGLSEG